jgi:hypothetical protein
MLSRNREVLAAMVGMLCGSITLVIGIMVAWPLLPVGAVYLWVMSRVANRIES